MAPREAAAPIRTARLELVVLTAPFVAAVAAEALGALLDWATARYGVTRFLVALPSRRHPRPPAPFEIAVRREDSIDDQVEHIARLLESRR